MEGFFILFMLCLAAVPFLLPIAAWLATRQTRAQVEELQRTVEQLDRNVDQLKAQVRKEAAPPKSTATFRLPKPVVEAPSRPVAPPPAPVPAAPKVIPPPPQVTSPPVPRPPLPVTPVPPPPAPPRVEGFDMERLVGVKLFAAIAGIALVVAAIYFLKYSVDQGWLQPPVRVLMGVAVAVGLLIACELKAARKYPATANAMDAAAIAILFATFFAARAQWHLIPASVAFVLLAIVTALAVLLSIRRESLFIAVLGLLGGFATPILLSTGENRPVPLFAYLLLLNVGLAWVAYKKTWPVLTVLTLVFTTLYQWGWVLKYLTEPGDVSLAMGIFLVFPIVTFAGVLLSRRPALADATSGADATFERTALAAAFVPLTFSVFLAAVPAYGAQAPLLFGFLLLIDLGLFAIALVRRQMLLHTIAAAVTLIVTAIWLRVSYAADARTVALGFTAVFVAFYLAAPLVASWFGRPLEDEGELAEYAAPTLLFVFPALARLEPAFAAPLPLFGTLLVLLLLCAARAIATGRGGVYYIGAFFAVAAQGVWSVQYLDVARLREAVAIYAVFGIVAVAVPLIARRRGEPLLPEWGSGIVLIASLLLLLFLSAGDVSPAALWALALLLAVLNAGLFVESAGAQLPAVSIVGSTLSWLILAVWWMRSAGSVGILSSLSVLVGLSLVTLAGHAWGHTRPIDTAMPQPLARATRGLWTGGLFLGLGGQLFLFYVGLNGEWSVPPWPLFGALAVITLATTVASLYSRVPILHAAGVVAAAVVVAGWSVILEAAPWPSVALVAVAAVNAYGLAWIKFFRQHGDRDAGSAGVAVALVVGSLATVILEITAGRPPAAALIALHAATFAILLALAWTRQWRHAAILFATIAAIPSLAWQGPWHERLALAFALYGVFVAYPLVLGRRVAAARDPFIAAIVASAALFIAGRAALLDGGYGSIIGALPVVEAAVLAVLLRQLLRVETAGQRDLGRLALVAGAALAFITVAIPLQLEHQWITIGWALEGAALAWLFTRIPHRGLLYFALSLLAVVFVRLALNENVFRYEPRGELRILNWYLYTYLTAAAAMLVSSWWLWRSDEKILGVRPSQILPAGAVILLFLLLNIEIADYYATGPEITFRFGARASQDLTYTIGWLLFGMGLLAAGIYLRNRPARVTAVALIAVSAFKCFLYDLRELGGLYRVFSFVGLAIALALVSLALQKYVLSKPKDAADAPSAS